MYIYTCSPPHLYVIINKHLSITTQHINNDDNSEKDTQNTILDVCYTIISIIKVVTFLY